MSAGCCLVVDVADLWGSIQRNATVSPLLSLPAELRDKIWGEVLGGRLVHLDFDDDYDTSESESFTDSGQLHWKHKICQHDCKENRPDNFVWCGEEVPWRRPHAGCRFRDEDVYSDTYNDDPEPLCDVVTMHLTVLRASRQIYVEANRILWTTNTFSFPDGPTFGEFMETRNIHQKRLIHNLRFEMRWGWGDERHWNTALGIALVKSLTGLQTLRLQIVCDLEKERWDHNKDRFVRLTTYAEGLRKLSILPLTSAEIAVRTSINPLGPRRWGNPTELWQKHDRDQCAKDLKALLLNPRGAQVYAEYQSSKASRRAEYMEQLRECSGAWKPWLAIP